MPVRRTSNQAATAALKLARKKTIAPGKRVSPKMFSQVAKTKARDAREQVEARKRYQALAEAIPQIVWTSTPEGYVDYFNRRWFEYTGLTEDETYKQTKSILHLDDVALYNERWSTALRTGEEYVIEYRFRRASDGTYRWHLGRGIPIRDEKGHIIKWFGTSTDIDDQKKLEEHIRSANDVLEEKVKERTRVLEDEIRQRKEMEQTNLDTLHRLQTVMTSMHMGAVLADQEQNIISVNQRFCDLFDLKIEPDSLVGMKGDELIQKVTNRLLNPIETIQRLHQALSNMKPQVNAEVYLKNGTVLAREYVPLVADGNPFGHLVLYRDITLEKKIDASKSEFMSLASHQLRTPLTSIRWVLGKLSRMLDEKLSEAEKHLFTEGKKATMRMAGTIDTMLTISRIESGKVSLKLKDVHMHTFLKELLLQFNAETTEKNIACKIDCPDHVFLITDASFLSEIFHNLLGNSIKYNKLNGSVHIKVLEHSQTLKVQISDTGYGIPSDQHSMIFSKFFRASNVVNEDTEGSGLGLYLVHLLVTILGGKISFTSKEGEGTLFTVILPTVTDIS